MNKQLIITAFLFLSQFLYSSNLELTLEKAISIGIGNSTELNNKESLLQLDLATRTMSLRAFFPELSVNYSTNDNVTYESTDSYTKNLSFNVDQLIYDGGTTRINYILQGKKLELDQENLKNEIIQLKSTIWSNFHQLSIQELQLKYKMEALYYTKNEFEIVELKSRQGSLTQLDLIDAEISIKKLELEIETMKNGFEESMFQFKILLNLPSDTEITLNSSDFSDYRGFPLPWDMDEYKNLSLKYNAEYKTALLEVEKQNVQLKMAKVSLNPIIKLNGSIGLSGGEFPLTTPTYNLGFSVDFSNPLFPTSSDISGGKSGEETYNRNTSVNITILDDMNIYTSRKKLEKGLENAVYKLEKLSETIPFNAERIYISYNQKKKEIILESDLLKLEKRKLDVLTKQYELNELEFSKLLSARNGYSQAKVEYLSKVLTLLELERSIVTAIDISPDQLSKLRIEEKYEK